MGLRGWLWRDQGDLAARSTLNTKNKIWQIGGQYELYQNVNLKLMYEDQKIGAGYGLYSNGGSVAANQTQNIKTTTLELDALM